MISISAPGKLLLFGEHAVVYGYPCIVSAIDQRLNVTIEEIQGNSRVVAPESKDTRFVDEALRVAQYEWKLPTNGYQLTTKSSFTAKFGFGSSAAVTVATLKALSEFFHKNQTPRQLFEIAYLVVVAVQGVGSGFDVAAAIYGGTLYFITGGKVIEPLPVQKMPLVVGYTGVKADTTSLVQAVAEKKKKFPEKVDRIFAAVGKLTDQAKEAIAVSDWERLGKLMDFNQEYLRDLGVSSEKLESLISAAKKAGAYGAKLSGAGGGDCMIALCPDEAQSKPSIIEAMRSAGGEVIDVRLNEEGVRVNI